MAFRFLHVADLHLETPFGGRSRRTRDRLRRAAHEAFERAVDVALDQGCHAVLAAGDLFDEGLLSTRTELFLAHQVRRLAEGGCWFLACAGNHDPGERGGRLAELGLARSSSGPEAEPESEREGTESPSGDEPWRQRVHLFLEPAPRLVEVTDADGRAVGRVVGAGHGSAAEESNLAASFPDLRGELPVVGLLHTQVATARRAAEHARYAPSTAVDFQRRSYAYWALGHVHLRQRAVEGLPVWYAGNLQGRNPRESGPKGGLLVEAHAGASAEPTFVPLAPVRWLRLTADGIGDCATAEALRAHLAARIADERGDADELVVVVDLAGPTPLAGRLRDADERAGLEEALGAEPGVLEAQLFVERTVRPVDRERVLATPSVLVEALELIAAAQRDDGLLEELAPPDLAAEGDWADRPEDERDAARHAYLRALVGELEPELWERALQREETGA